MGLGVEVAAPPPDLRLTAAPSDSMPAVGDTITITLTVTNVGRGPAVNAVIPRAFTEAGFTVIRTAPLEGSYDEPTHEWRIPLVAVAGQARMRLTAIVLPPADGMTELKAAAPAAARTPTAAPTSTPAAGAPGLGLRVRPARTLPSAAAAAQPSRP